MCYSNATQQRHLSLSLPAQWCCRQHPTACTPREHTPTLSKCGALARRTSARGTSLVEGPLFQGSKGCGQATDECCALLKQGLKWVIERMICVQLGKGSEQLWQMNPTFFWGRELPGWSKAIWWGAATSGSMHCNAALVLSHHIQHSYWPG